MVPSGRPRSGLAVLLSLVLGAGAALGVSACGEDRGGVEVEGGTGTATPGTGGTTTPGAPGTTTPGTTTPGTTAPGTTAPGTTPAPTGTAPGEPPSR